MGLSGVANQGCDIGGFYGPAPEAELLVRWIQNGIFQPRFSIHSTNTDNTVTEPWMYSGCKEYIKKAIEFRYQLIPYLYSLMERAHETGLPIMDLFAVHFRMMRNVMMKAWIYVWRCASSGKRVEKGAKNPQGISAGWRSILRFLHKSAL